MTLAPGDPRHGTANGYGNQGCRCDECREANRHHHAAYMDRVRSEGRILGTHGKSTAYTSGCRCSLCRASHNERSRAFKARRRASAGEADATNYPRGDGEDDLSGSS